MLKFDSSNLIRNLAKKEKLVPHIDRVWETFDEPLTFAYEPKKGDFGWHPSSDCTPPVSHLFTYAYTQLYEQGPEFIPSIGPEPMRPASRKAFILGHYWHQVLQHIICHKLEWCSPQDIERRGYRSITNNRELEYKPFGFATGSGDIVNCKAPGWTGLVDIKTMKNDHFKQKGLPTDTYGGKYSVSDKYECQVNIYMDFFDQDSAIILAVNKDSGEFKEVMFERDQELIDTIYAKWETVSGYLDTGEIPPEELDDEFELPVKGPVSG